MDKIITKDSKIENWKYTNSSQFKTFKNIFSFDTVEKKIIPKNNEIIIKSEKIAKIMPDNILRVLSVFLLGLINS